VNTVRDLLYHFPRRHLAVVLIRDLALGEEQAVVGNVWTVGVLKLGAAQQGATEAVIGDETGNIRVMWYNQPFVARSVQANDRIMVSGRMRPFRGQRTLEATAYEVLTGDDEVLQQGRLAPVYPSTEGLSQRMLRRVVRRTLDGWLPRLEEFLPQGVLQRQGLMPLPEALLSYHYPADAATRDLARRRLAFDELLLIQLVLLSRKQHWQEKGAGTPIPRDARLLEAFLRSLPFTLTEAQRRVLGEILADIASPRPMARLLQGDVGSGKTVVALAAMLMVAAQGQQAALMAPTAILAEQHFRTFGNLLQGLSQPVRQPNFLAVYIDPFPKPFGVALLVGSMKKREKEEVQSRVREHLVDILVGTHALIQEEVGFERLALAVADEQHRFGVVQRRLLSEKGHKPHILSMSATPIPRSLALTLYGDLDISTIDEMPRGRRPIRTRWVGAHQRQAAYTFLQRQVQQGRQAFVICPLIDESEALQTRAAVEEHRRLSKDVFPDLRVGLLHGRMPAADKDAVMERFRAGELDILVSTPVVEVGVDIPNASVMFIEGADRFGLSELHQFRGRVGRGEHPSYCLLLAEDPSPEAKERLALLERESDGFRVAEEDLRLRGPGELLGTRQSGLPDLKLARLSDLELLAQARKEAGRLLSEDPELARPEHQALARTAARVTPAAETE
jgi:ATP-dependent DNA helicase RecG